MDSVPATAKHPIRVVTARTGLSPDVLRAWERRYQVVEPSRSGGRQRLYSDADVERLKLLHRAIIAGRSIGAVAGLSPRELEKLVRSDDSAARVAAPALAEATTRAIASHLATAFDAIQALDAARLERILKTVSLQLSVPTMLDHFIAPLLWRIGDRWVGGDISPAQEHLASLEVRRLLAWLVERAAVEPDAPVIVVTTTTGQLVELGAMLAAASAATEGWRVAYLGTSLPAKDIITAARTLGARAVAISLVLEADGPETTKELDRLAKGLPRGIALIGGGRAAAAHALQLRRLGAQVFRDLVPFRTWLRSAR